MDTLVKGLVCDDAISFYAIDGTQMVRDAKRVHDTTATCTAALGRTLMGTAMMGVMLKDSGKLTVLIKGDGEAGSIVCVANQHAQIKGYITNARVELPPKSPGKLDVAGAVGKNGKITVVRDMGLKEPYVGQSALLSGEIAEDFAGYFLHSAGLPSLVYLGVHIDCNFQVSAATGIILQPLPNCDALLVDLLENRAGAIATLTQTVQDGHTLQEALQRILGDMQPEITAVQTPLYRCDCSKERLQSVLVSLGESELQDMIQKDAGAELCCHFCNEKYNFSSKELTDLLAYAQSKESE